MTQTQSRRRRSQARRENFHQALHYGPRDEEYVLQGLDTVEKGKRSSFLNAMNSERRHATSRSADGHMTEYAPDGTCRCLIRALPG